MGKERTMVGVQSRISGTNKRLLDSTSQSSISVAINIHCDVHPIK